jgi:glucokinase
MEIIAVDIGGTHVRFARAELRDGHVARLDDAMTLRTGDHADLPAAWRAFGQAAGYDLPSQAAIAVAAPISGESIALTNSHWIIRPDEIAGALGIERAMLINDFGAVGHAVARVAPQQLRHLCGPERDLSADEVISIVGPGTGLGVAHVVRRGGRDFVIEGEGGHIGFAPVDMLEDGMVARLRERHGRVSVERVVSGPGLAFFYEALGGGDLEDAALWGRALQGSDPIAVAALDCFCRSLGSVAGDIALAQGGTAVVIAGGLGLRLAEHLPGSGFAERFVAKGRFEAMMAGMPVKLLMHPQPGLYGAAAAFAAEQPATRLP